MTRHAIPPQPAAQAPAKVPGEVLEAVAQSLVGLRFGVIQLTVHEGRVVQLDVTERQRFT